VRHAHRWAQLVRTAHPTAQRAITDNTDRINIDSASVIPKSARTEPVEEPRFDRLSANGDLWHFRTGSTRKQAVFQRSKNNTAKIFAQPLDEELSCSTLFLGGWVRNLHISARHPVLFGHAVYFIQRIIEK